MRKCNRRDRSLAVVVAAAGVSLPALARADVPITQFTPGDYLIMRGGDPTNPDGPSDPDYGGEVNAYIDEYSQAGYYVGTLDLPQMTLPGGSASSHEGNLNISPNGQWIAFAGYDPTQSPVGITPHNSDGTENAVLGEVNLAQGPSSLNASTILPGSTSNSLTGQYVHSAMTIDGNEFYVGAKYIDTAGGKLQTSDTGLVYVSGTGTSSTDTVLEGGTDWRNILAFNGQLYGATGSSSVGTHGVYQIGTGLPTTNNPIPGHTEITDYPGGQSASSFAFVDVQTSDTSAGASNGYNVLYTEGDQSVPGITKYYFNTSTQTWDESALQVPLNSANNINDPYDIVATVDPTNPAWVDLTISGQNGVYSYIDKSGDPETGLPGGAFTQLITTPSYASFYGMTQDPGPANLVWAKAGNGSTWEVGGNLNWTYAGSNTAFANGENVTFDDTSNNPNVILNSTVQPGSVTFEDTVNNYTISGTGSIGGDATLRLLPGNTSTVTLSTANTYAGGTIVSGGTLKILPTGSATTSGLGTGALTINGTGLVQLADNVTAASAAPTSNVNITSLSITGNGTLDIGNNHIIIDYGNGPDPIASIEALITSGFNGGSWTGTGITSSDAAANAGSYGIGYADAADPGNPAGLSSGQIEIRYTLLGDANLDGKVNGADFTIMAANFNQGGKVWDQGDFNYDGEVNGADFTLLAANFNQSATLSAVGAEDLTALDDFAAANGISLTNVPEPGALGPLALIAGAFFAAGNRKTKKILGDSITPGARRRSAGNDFL
jgi:autotransporter-associated beta strand protein